MSPINNIPEEIKECRDYIRLKFPKIFAGRGLQDFYVPKEKRREVRDAMVAIGFAPGLVQIAMREPKWFYRDGVNTYPTHKTYNVVEKYRDQYGWWRRSHVFGENLEEELYKLRCEGHIVGTREEVIKHCEISSSESPCGHLKGTCGCADGLVVDRLYEISYHYSEICEVCGKKNDGNHTLDHQPTGKIKPPVIAHYIRWKNDSRIHEFRTDDNVWISVKPIDVKARVKDVATEIAKMKGIETPEPEPSMGWTPTPGDKQPEKPMPDVAFHTRVPDAGGS
jgi:hypothetical protein